MTQPLGTAALPRFLAHSAAGAAAGCAAVHGLALVAAPHPGAAGTAALVAACLLCAVHLWRRPGRAAWGLHVVLTAAMLGSHPPVAAHHGVIGLAAWSGPVAGLLAVVALLLAAVRYRVVLRRTGERDCRHATGGDGSGTGLAGPRGTARPLGARAPAAHSADRCGR